MPIDSLRLLQSADAYQVLNRLGHEARFVGLVPSLGDIPIISDPENVLTQDEINLITTGREDMMLRATFNSMSLPLKFVLRHGYGINWVNGDLKHYMDEQKPWYNQSRNLLQASLGREPSHIEAERHYSLDGGLFFFLRHVLTHQDAVVQRRRYFETMPRCDADYLEALVNPSFTHQPAETNPTLKSAA